MSEIEEQEKELLHDKEYLLNTKSKNFADSENGIEFKSPKQDLHDFPSKLNKNNHEKILNKILIENNNNKQQLISQNNYFNNSSNSDKYEKSENNYNKHNSNDEINPKKNTQIKKERLFCLDIFRGVTLFYMVIVNSHIGDHVYWVFTETDWNGLTPADCIFPSFLFIMGVAIILSSPNIKEKKCSKFLNILKRSIILFLLGFFFNLQIQNFIHFENLRIMGVLQRLGITYFFVSLLHLFLDEFYFTKNTTINMSNNEIDKVESIKVSILSSFRFEKKNLIYLNYGLFLQILIIFLFLLSYNLISYSIDIPMCGKGNIDKFCFAGSYIDRMVFGDKHLWVQYEYDPEGLVSTISASYPVFIGYFYGKILRFIKNKKKEIQLSNLNIKRKVKNISNDRFKSDKMIDENFNDNLKEDTNDKKLNADVKYINNENENLIDLIDKDSKQNKKVKNQGNFIKSNSFEDDSNKFQPKIRNLIDQDTDEERTNLNLEIRKLDFILLYFWLILTLFNLAMGLILNTLFEIPFNKKAYTLSFAFFVSGISGTFLCFFYIILDLIKNDKFKNYFTDYFFEPFKWMGMNSLLVFCGSTFYSILLEKNIKFKADGKESISLYKYIYDKVFLKISINNEFLGEFFIALFESLLFMFISYLFYRKKCFIKI